MWITKLLQQACLLNCYCVRHCIKFLRADTVTWLGCTCHVALLIQDRTIFLGLYHILGQLSSSPIYWVLTSLFCLADMSHHISLDWTTLLSFCVGRLGGTMILGGAKCWGSRVCWFPGQGRCSYACCWVLLWLLSCQGSLYLRYPHFWRGLRSNHGGGPGALCLPKVHFQWWGQLDGVTVGVVIGCDWFDQIAMYEEGQVVMVVSKSYYECQMVVVAAKFTLRSCGWINCHRVGCTCERMVCGWGHGVSCLSPFIITFSCWVLSVGSSSTARLASRATSSSAMQRRVLSCLRFV